MKSNLKNYSYMYLGILGILMLLSACSTTVKREELKEIYPAPDSYAACTNCAQQPVVVTEVWEEPMVDVTEIPPGLDPEAHYYRPAHKSIVEIRQGRWQYYRRPGEERQ